MDILRYLLESRCGESEKIISPWRLYNVWRDLETSVHECRCILCIINWIAPRIQGSNKKIRINSSSYLKNYRYKWEPIFFYIFRSYQCIGWAGKVSKLGALYRTLDAPSQLHHG